MAHRRGRGWETRILPETIEVVRQLTAVGCVGGGESRVNSSSGIKALMLAVFEDGVRCYLGPAGGHRTEAEAWVSSKRSAAFSFNTVCEMLSFDPDAVRRALLRLRGELRQLNRIRSYARGDK